MHTKSATSCATACVARIAELTAHAEGAAAEALEVARTRATPTLIDVLRRYPPVLHGNNRVEQLMSTLDQSLRASR